MDGWVGASVGKLLTLGNPVPSFDDSCVDSVAGVVVSTLLVPVGGGTSIFHHRVIPSIRVRVVLYI
jgi:hypothetical protein